MATTPMSRCWLMTRICLFMVLEASGMAAFLDCLQQFKEEVERGDSGFCLPYEMEKGKIRDPATGNSFSVKIQFNSEEQWTKAMKYMLTNLKWGLAWVTSKYTTKPPASAPGLT